MTVQFQDWLEQLRAARQGPASINIDRGMPFVWRFALSGIWTGAVVKASLRLTPDAAGTTLADFAVTGPEVEGDLTVFVLSLTKEQTAGLPVGAANEGTAIVVFDTLITPAGAAQQRLFGGAATISGKVTNAS